MESRKAVIRETLAVLLGVAVCAALMCGVFALLHKFDMTVLLGAALGTALTVLNFFSLAMVATLAADRAQQQDVEGGKKLLKGSYPIRILALAVVLFACAKSGYFNVIALVLPLVFVRPVITVLEFFRKKGA